MVSQSHSQHVFCIHLPSPLLSLQPSLYMLLFPSFILSLFIFTVFFTSMNVIFLRLWHLWLPCVWEQTHLFIIYLMFNTHKQISTTVQLTVCRLREKWLLSKLRVKHFDTKSVAETSAGLVDLLQSLTEVMFCPPQAFRDHLYHSGTTCLGCVHNDRWTLCLEQNIHTAITSKYAKCIVPGLYQLSKSFSTLIKLCT